MRIPREDVRNDGAGKGEFPNGGKEPSIAATATNDTPFQPQFSTVRFRRRQWGKLGGTNSQRYGKRRMCDENPVIGPAVGDAENRY